MEKFYLFYLLFIGSFYNFFQFISGVRPYKCNLCEKSFTQRCSLESHCMKVHGVAHSYEYKQRRSKVYWLFRKKLIIDIDLKSQFDFHKSGISTGVVHSGVDI